MPRPTCSVQTAAPRSRSSPSALCLAWAASSLAWPALLASVALASPISAEALTLSMSPMCVLFLPTPCTAGVPGGCWSTGSSRPAGPAGALRPTGVAERARPAPARQRRAAGVPVKPGRATGMSDGLGTRSSTGGRTDGSRRSSASGLGRDHLTGRCRAAVGGAAGALPAAWSLAGALRPMPGCGSSAGTRAIPPARAAGGRLVDQGGSRGHPPGGRALPGRRTRAGGPPAVVADSTVDRPGGPRRRPARRTGGGPHERRRTPSRELAHVVTDIQPEAAVVETAGACHLGSALGDRVMVGTDRRGSTGRRRGCRRCIDRVRPEDPALILYDLGDHRSPQGGGAAPPSPAGGPEAVRLAWRWGDPDRLVHASRSSTHMGCASAPTAPGGRGVGGMLLPKFDPAAVTDTAAPGRGESLLRGPTMYHRLVDLGRRPVTCVPSGSVCRARPAVRRAAPGPGAALGSPMLERYGMTETLMTCPTPTRGLAGPGRWGSRSVSRFACPFPRVEAQAEPMTGGFAKSVRGPNVFDGYWDRPVATAEAFTAAAERLAVVPDGRPGRRRGRVCRDPRPREGDDHLGGVQHPPDRSRGRAADPSRRRRGGGHRHPSDEWGEVVTAWIVADGRAPSVEDLDAFAGAALAPYKHPRLVHVVDELPRTPWARCCGTTWGARGALGCRSRHRPTRRRRVVADGAKDTVGEGPRCEVAPDDRSGHSARRGSASSPAWTRWAVAPGPAPCRSVWWCSTGHAAP